MVAGLAASGETDVEAIEKSCSCSILGEVALVYTDTLSRVTSLLFSASCYCSGENEERKEQRAEDVAGRRMQRVDNAVA